jgi:nucleotide-binding universal stress UspA family protein
MQQEIIAAYDGSEQSRAALEWAAEECRARYVGLTLCEVWCGPYPGRADGVATEERRLASRDLAEGARLAERLLPGREIRPALIHGDPKEALVTLSREAAMLVVGHRELGHREFGGVAGLLLGSVSAYLASQARCPIIVVRGPRPRAGAPHGVVVGVDGSAPSAAAVEFAVHLARRRRMPLTAVYALGEGTRSARSADKGEQTLAELVGPWQARYGSRIVISSRVVPERPLHALLACASGAALVVVGSTGVGGVRVRLGSVSQGLLRQASCPVAVVKRDPRRFAG